MGVFERLSHAVLEWAYHLYVNNNLHNRTDIENWNLTGKKYAYFSIVLPFDN